MTTRPRLVCTLIGLLPPLAGEVRLEDVTFADVTVRARAQRIAYVSQLGTQAFGFSLRETVLMGPPRAPARTRRTRAGRQGGGRRRF